MPGVPLSSPHSPITDFIPRHSLNILCGPPFAAKDKLLRTAVRDYLAAGHWLGSRAPISDDGEPELARVGFIGPGRSLPSEVAYVSWATWDSRSVAPATLPALYDQFPEPRPQLLIVDNIQSLMPGGKVNDYCPVMWWGRDLSSWMQAHDVTLIGLAPATKSREEEGGYPPFNRILGSVAWAQIAHTVWLLDLVDRRITAEAMASSIRVLITMTHGPHPTSWVYYDLDSEGWLVPTLGPPAPTEAVWRAALAASASAEDSDIKTGQFVAWGDSLGVSKATVDRWLADMLDEGRIARIRKGLWKWLDKPATPC